jgi:hypothetical protein
MPRSVLVEEGYDLVLRHAALYEEIRELESEEPSSEAHAFP